MMFRYGYGRSVCCAWKGSITCFHKYEVLPGIVTGGYDRSWWSGFWKLYCFKEPGSLFSDATTGYFPLKSLPELDN